MRKTLRYHRQVIVDYIRSGGYKNVLLQFYHGLGDAITFYANCLPLMRRELPDVRFSFETWHGQQEMFGEVDSDESHYDLAIRIFFHCSEWEPGELTKAERFNEREFGVPFQQSDNYHMPYKFGSPLVGCHFHSTSCYAVSADELLAHTIWEKITVRGLIPLDTHFVHPGCDIEQKPFPWEHRNVADTKAPTVGKLFGLLGSLGGFCGVSSGNFWSALCVLPPECILYIETEFPASKLTRLPVHSVKSIADLSGVDAWLDDIEAHIAKKANK